MVPAGKTMAVSRVRRELVLVLELVVNQAREVLRGTTAASNESQTSRVEWDEESLVVETQDLEGSARSFHTVSSIPGCCPFISSWRNPWETYSLSAALVLRDVAGFHSLAHLFLLFKLHQQITSKLLSNRGKRILARRFALCCLLVKQGAGR